MMKPLHALAIALGVVYLLALAHLQALERRGPAHTDLSLPGNIPATLYMPGAGDPIGQVFPPAERPPCVVLGHGFLADRKLMSALARRIAENGYAVLAFDFHGHGENRNPLEDDFLNPHGGLNTDLEAAVQYMRGYRFVDGSRIVVIGHSMGASAVLNYATSDPALKGAVMISGGFGLPGPNPPKNALFIFAERDPVGIQESSQQLAAHLAGVPQIELGKLYGDPAQANAVEAVRVPGVDHIGIVYSADAVQTIVKWLDGAVGMNRTQPVNTADPRLNATLIVSALFLVVLVPIGRITASIAGAREQPAGSGWLGLLFVAIALLAAMPLTSLNPAGFTALVIGDVQTSWFMVAGALLLAGLLFWNRLDSRWLAEPSRMLLGAALLFTVLYACHVAASPAFHAETFTPERAAAWALVAVLVLPFWAGFEFVLRRGSVLISTITASIGRALIVVLTMVGMSLGVLPGVFGLILPIVVIIFVQMEIFAASAYSASRNVLFIAVAESMWFAWTVAATNPIAFRF